MMNINVEIGNREQILGYYKRQRPAELDGLVEWLTKRYKGSYKSVRIPCFLKSDPQIYIYGERLKTGPIIVAVSWNPEIEEWEDSLFADRTEEQPVIDEFRHTIESLSCTLLRLN